MRDVHDDQKVISQEEICSSSLLTLKAVLRRNFANLKELAPKYEKWPLLYFDLGHQYGRRDVM